MTWTWDKKSVERLCKGHMAGLSFSAMAEMFGLKRGAIAGKCFRLNLTRPGDQSSNGRIGGKISAQKRRMSKLNFARPNAAARVKAAVVSVPPPPDAPPLPLLKLEAKHCRWPVGDPRTPDFGFCGQDKKVGSYCEHHARIAYRATQT